MKTKEELTALKNEYENLNAKLADLTKEELEQVSGGLVLLGPEHLEVLKMKSDIVSVQTYEKDRGSDKNAKVIFN